LQLPDTSRTIDLSKLDINAGKVRLSPFKPFTCSGVQARGCINNLAWGTDKPSFEYSGALGLVLIGLSTPADSLCVDGSIASIQVVCGGAQKLETLSVSEASLDLD
jgi:hypothetical protein